MGVRDLIYRKAAEKTAAFLRYAKAYEKGGKSRQAFSCFHPKQKTAETVTFQRFFVGGQGWIRTIEVVDGRFTV